MFTLTPYLLICWQQVRDDRPAGAISPLNVQAERASRGEHDRDLDPGLREQAGAPLVQGLWPGPHLPRVAPVEQVGPDVGLPNPDQPGGSGFGLHVAVPL